jgi:UDP-3-O-[3-hydroxymyristoyl] glucosamine N-acyltransferase
VRAKKFWEIVAKGYAVGTYIHPWALLPADAHVGEGSILLDSVTVHPGTRIGRSVWMTGGNNIGHDCTVEDFCWVCSGATLAGGVTLGEGSFVGVGASIADGVRIGKRNYIGAGTHVAHDTSDDGVYIAEHGKKFRMKSKAFLEFIR